MYIELVWYGVFLSPLAPDVSYALLLGHNDTNPYGCSSIPARRDEAGSDPCGHPWVTWGVYLCAGKPPLADIILSHPPDLT